MNEADIQYPKDLIGSESCPMSLISPAVEIRNPVDVNETLKAGATYSPELPMRYSSKWLEFGCMGRGIEPPTISSYKTKSETRGMTFCKVLILVR
jgi:hypothetical protein